MFNLQTLHWIRQTLKLKLGTLLKGIKDENPYTYIAFFCLDEHFLQFEENFIKHLVVFANTNTDADKILKVWINGDSLRSINKTPECLLKTCITPEGLVLSVLKLLWV
ncbi:hypothetical protein AVEN_45845-1 [Araneus ventricosus]|uniref:Uncharacterized protein n=1 Tax=Araneus ventricosus TaxID=182803 RepID=A0A4Y2B729_ARAVE|nr:hypothetical protein AVEN_45845-1 [Araneus ventricosus]